MLCYHFIRQIIDKNISNRTEKINKINLDGEKLIYSDISNEPIK